MISDKYLFKQSEKVLDKIEHFASCYGFKTKEVLQIRLLAEELISVISPTLTLSDGRCWITTDQKSFSITIDCDAGINGLDADTKRQLMKISREEKKKGIFGMIGKVFEFLSVPDADTSTVTGRHMIYHYGIGAEMSGYYWSPDFAGVFPVAEVTSKPKENEKGEHDIELSIIEGYADDIHVLLQKQKTGVRLEITVVKNFTAEQIAEIEF